MKYPKHVSIELNEKEAINIIELSKDDKIKTNNLMTFFFKLFIIIIAFLISFIIYLFINLKYYKNKLENIPKNIYQNHYNFDIIEYYKKSQKDFCENPSKYINEKIEKEIDLFDVKVDGLNYQIYIYKTFNWILHEIKLFGSYEKNVSNNMIEALKYYKKKNNILNNKDIFILDIGGNIGWYPSLLGRYGYSILSFEAFEKNYYIEKKNVCLLNNDSNVIVITKGLGNEEKNCHYFIQKKNEGNGMVVCDDKEILNNKWLANQFIKKTDVEITTLSNFIPYLSKKSMALMKLDVEGQELKILEGGKELITEYHIPFVIIEFSPPYLKELGSEPYKLAQFFVDNGYKITIDGFLSKNYITINQLIAHANYQIISEN